MFTVAVDSAAAGPRHKLNVTLKVQNVFTMAQVAANSSLLGTLPERLAHRLAEKFTLQVLPLPLAVPDVRMALY